MASLKLEHIYKVYPNGHKAVSDFNMQIADGEFIVFVGPSGCGKSTTLRMIAGLEDISSGELYIGDTLVNDMQPKERDIAMVFQNYALYPHMTVYENMAFGLTLRKVPRTEIHEKVMWAADVLGLKEYLDRKPKAMSGGQRQRVSLGRAILRNPKVMLLDEPLSNLDAKLRSQMRSEISKLHQQLKTTFIYVTHDQVEAMTLGTRVVVMKLGRVQQIDTPQNLYDHPINKFVAGFIGTPQMNFFNVTLKEQKDHVDVNWKDCKQPALKISKDAVLKAEKKYLDGSKDVVLGFRCEAISAEGELKGDNIVDVTVSHFEELGNETLIYGDLKEVAGLGNDSTTSVIIKASSKLGHVPGDVIKAKINVEKIQLFDAKTEMTIIPMIPEYNVLDVNVANGKMDLFGVETKPESIPVDFLKDGFVKIPLSAIKIGQGKVEAKVISIEKQKDVYLALVEASGKKLYVFVNAKTKVGDKLKFSVDYSCAEFKDKDDKVVASPLIAKDDLSATFVNFKTAYEVTQNEEFNVVKQKRIDEVNHKYDELFAKFNEEKTKALADAQAKQQQAASGSGTRKAEIDAERAKLKSELVTLKQDYKNEMKEIKAKHKQIYNEEMAKLNDQFKAMWEKEASDFKQNMAINKDPDSRRSRKLSYQIFKENFPLMKANDFETKKNALEFDKETDINAAKSRYNHTKGIKQDTIKDNERKFKEEFYPYDLAVKEFALKEKELNKKKEDDLIHSELIFFFKYNNHYQLIPDEITKKIIQGLGNKVFTKIFRISVPHTSFVEGNVGINYKVTSFINYGDVQMYKCNCIDDGSVVYMNKTRNIELGSEVHIEPDLLKTEVYESELNIRLY